MVIRNQGPLKSSCNAGELSTSLAKKLGLKQFYNGGLRFKNIEPVPQSGFRLGPGSADIRVVASATCRLYCLTVRRNLSYMLVFTEGSVDIYRCETREKVKTLALPSVTADRLPGYDFYAEGSTVGMFHEDDWNGIRIFRNDETDWTVDAWPYQKLAHADLGGTYAKSQDRLDIYVRFTDNCPRLTLACRVDGEETEGVDLVDGSGNLIKPEDATGTDRARLASDLQTALRALPSLNNDVDVAYQRGDSFDNYWVFRVAFTNSLAGVEYDFNCDVPNTSEASALVNHVQFGEKDLEALISSTRGGFGGMALFQDRAVYFDAKARKSAINPSRIGEYFDLDHEIAGANGPILTAIRTDSGERILHMVVDGYLLAFTDQAEYFITNRTISQDEPLNIVEASRIGTRDGVRPQIFDGRTWFVSRDGSSLYTTQYDAVKEKFQPTPEDMLATHLVDGIKRQWVQRKVEGSTMPRLWELRTDGRLVYGIVVADQEITAFVEWVAAGDGEVIDMMPDGNDQIWIVTRRGSTIRLEVMEEASDNLFQASKTVTTDLAGLATGLTYLNGRDVWVRKDGYVLGPFTVTDGTVDTGLAGATDAQIGLWQPPVYESMPFWKLIQGDEILERPAQVKVLTVNVMETESLAVGANGRPLRNVDLSLVIDDLSEAPVPYSGTLTVAGLNGAAEGPTVVISQLRPGKLRVRDYTPGVKF
jgi:hypothetical protein